jgi:hypothetical protein
MANVYFSGKTVVQCDRMFSIVQRTPFGGRIAGRRFFCRDGSPRSSSCGIVARCRPRFPSGKVIVDSGIPLAESSCGGNGTLSIEKSIGAINRESSLGDWSKG